MRFLGKKNSRKKFLGKKVLGKKFSEKKYYPSYLVVPAMVVVV